METLIIILLLIVLFAVLQERRKLSDHLNRLSDQIDELIVQVYRLEKRLKTPEKQAKEEIDEQTISETKTTVKETPEVVEEKDDTEEPIVEKAEHEQIEEHEEKKTPAESKVQQSGMEKLRKRFSFLDIFSDRNKLEEFIGGNLFNKIGIIVLVLGLAYAVKYAIDKDWIGNVGRVAIGLISGGILIGIAHSLRKKYNAFSSVLVGGGLATLYFTISLAFHEYNLFTIEAAFLIMVIITAFAVVLSLVYNRIELAVFALFGGFASPLLVSTGEGNYIVLFSYILILNVGMMILASFKKWHLINIISYVSTILLYGAWFISTEVNSTVFPYIGAFIFATAFYLVFFHMNIINNLRTKAIMSGVEVSILISLTFLYYGTGLYCIEALDLPYKGIFTIILAVFNFIYAFIFFRNSKIDRRMVYLLIGLVLTFISLTAPAQLEGNYITIFWAAEAALLLWLYAKSGLKLARITSIIVTFLMIISWIIDIYDVYYSYNSEQLQIVFNKGFITGLFVSASLVVSILTIKQLSQDEKLLWRINNGIYRILLTVFAIIALYVTCMVEIAAQAINYTTYSYSASLFGGAFNALYLVLLMIFGNKLKVKQLRTVLYLLSVVYAFYFISIYNSEIIESFRNLYLMQKAAFWFYGFHYLTTFLLFGLLSLMLANTKQTALNNETMQKIMQWFVVFIGMFVLSAELEHIIVIAGYNTPTLINVVPENFEYEFEIQFYDIVRQLQSDARLAGFPVLWGIGSFVLMLLGLRLKMLNLRIIALVLFFITLIKLFTYDVWQMPDGGKILAFILLGVILLVVSFLYQKLKQIIFETKDEDAA